MPEKVIIPVGNQEIVIETGRYAKQADGSVTVQLGETIVLVAAVAASKAKPGQEFFPLTVDYRERAAAAGKFPGGYFKREGRPSEKEILTSRLTDRPIRPLFPKGWFNEVQVQSVLLSADGQNDPDILSILGASAALSVSDIPWDGPLGAVRVGRVGGELVVNPTHAQQAESDLDLIYVGNKTDVVMYEGSANEISEEDFIAALKFAQEACLPQIAAQEDLVRRAGKSKRQITVNVVPDAILSEAKALAGERIIPALLTTQKLAREAAVNAVFAEVGEKLKSKFGEQVNEFVLKDAQYYIQKETVRGLILDSGKRLDGRSFEQVRPIHGDVGVLPRAHGSSMFARGETQTVCLATLGTSDDIQEFDSYTGGETKKQFILHYNFPNFSVGETGRISGPGRREIGHGALAERSVLPMIPLQEYPYALRVTSEIMESNGSTSMASVCGASLALMDAGVPLKRPVAGISVGICTEYGKDHQISRYQLLTDIIGWEDAFCDMDCKIAGTANGITGFQLDLKLRGLPLPIMTEAIESARKARLLILDEMAKVLPEPRTDISKYAPRITVLRVNPEKIGLLIGPGGKNIKRIVDESGCEINIEDDGTVKVFSLTPEGMEIARREIESISAEIEVGKTYKGRVVTLKEFGVFVEVFPGQDGLVHVSELSSRRVNRPEDVVKMGDEVWVKCIGVDEKGRVKLSRKAAMEERGEAVAAQAETAGAPAPEREERAERGDRDRDRDRDRGRGDRESRGSDRDRSDRPERDRDSRGDRGDRDTRDREPRGESRDRSDRPARSDRDRTDRSDRDRDSRGGDRDSRGGDRDSRSSDRDREPREGDRERSDRPERTERSDRDRGGRGERSSRGDRGSERGGERGGERRDRRPTFDDVGEGLEVGKLYRSKVVSIKDFGAFVEFLPGREGLVHVSELANFRVKQVEDIVQVGDEITVKLLGVDDKGRVRLSRRAAIEDRERAEGGDRPASDDDSGDEGERRETRDDRFED